MTEELNKGGNVMPQIDVHLIKGVFDAEQKKQIIQKLTDAMVSVGVKTCEA